MTVKIQEGMRFQHNPIEKGNEFEVHKVDFYDDGEPIWCACVLSKGCKATYECCPLDEICLGNYMPMVDGQWVNEPNEYEF